MMDRPPPHNEDAEKSLVGALMLGALAEANGEVRVDDLYFSKNAEIVRAMLHLRDNREPGIDFGGEPERDVQLIACELDRRGVLEEIGGVESVFQCMETVPHTAHWRYYLDIVRDLADRRRLIQGAQDVLRRVHEDPRCDLAEVREKFTAATTANDHGARGAISIGDLMEQFPDLDEPLLEGLIRRGETANIAGGTKSGKTWLMIGLSLSIATGRDWLGRFRCTPGKVLILDNELKPATIGKRVRSVADAMGIPLYEYADRIDVEYLRGRGVDLYGFRPIVRRAGTKYAAIIVDSWYRALPPGVSENANEDQTMLYNLVDEYADMTKAGWFLVKHPTKGGQAGKSVTDVGAGAGSQSRATDSHIVLREHDEEGAAVLEAAVRTFPPVIPFPIRWNFPIWLPADDLDPAALKGRKTAGEQRKAQDDREAQRDVIKALRKGPASISELRRRTGGMGKTRCENAVYALEAAGDIESKPTRIRGNDCREYQIRDTERT